MKKGDQVQVITGNHKGAAGKVLQVLPKKQQVLIEGVRMIKKHTKKSQDNPQGAIIEREGPIHISNVKLVEQTEDTEQGDEQRRSPRRKRKPPSYGSRTLPILSKTASSPRCRRSTATRTSTRSRRSRRSS